MGVLNDFIESNISSVLDYYAKVSSDDDSDEGPRDIDPTTIFEEHELAPEVLPPLVRETSIAILHAYCLKNRKVITEEISKDHRTDAAQAALSKFNQVLDVLSEPLDFEEEEEECLLILLLPLMHMFFSF